MKFKCEKCGTRYTIAEEKVRNRVLKIRCKVCENVITVRDPEGTDQPAPWGGGRPAPAGVVSGPADADFASDRTAIRDPLAPVADVEWYCAVESGQKGPMPLERLRDLIRTGQVRREDFVWNETMADWVAASTVNALGDLFRPKPPPLPPPRASRPPSIPLGETASESSAHRSESATRVEPAVSSMAREPVRSELDVDLLSLLGMVSPGSLEASATEMMPSSQSPTRPVENDELAALIAAEMAAPATVQAPALDAVEAPAPAAAAGVTALTPAAATVKAPTLAEQLSVAPTQAIGASNAARVAAPRKVDDAFGFGDLHDQPTALPAIESGVRVVHEAPPARRGILIALIVVASLLLVGVGVGLGIVLAPKGGGPPVAAPSSAPLSGALASPEASAAPAAVPTEAPPSSIASTAPSSVVSTAPPSAPATEVAVGGGGGAIAAPAADDPVRPVAARGPKAPAPASRLSAFAGLDAARGDQRPELTPKVEKPGGNLPPGLDQVEISAVIKRNIKGVQGCHQRQLKRDEGVAEGRATIRFRIQSDGRAKDVSMDRRFDGSVLKQCIVNLVERWAFPPFEGDPIPVEFPVIFTATF